VEIPVRARFYANEMGNVKTFHNAPLVREFDWTLRIPKLDQGKDDAFSFYVVSMTDLRSAFLFGGSVKAKKQDGSDLFLKTMMPGDVMSFGFLPQLKK
jgi:hypothetical protein